MTAMVGYKTYAYVTVALRCILLTARQSYHIPDMARQTDLLCVCLLLCLFVVGLSAPSPVTVPAGFDEQVGLWALVHSV